MASVVRRKLKNGESRYDVRYRTPDGSVRTVTRRTLKDAKALAANVEADLSRGQWVDPRSMATTFADWSAEWLASNPGKRAKTLRANESTLRLHLLPTLSARAMGSIGPRDVQGLVNAWVAAGYAPNSVHRFYETLRAVCNAAVAQDVIGRTPCRGIKLPRVKAAKGRALSPDEVRALAAEVGKRYEALVYTAAVLGLRWSECAGLRVRDVDFLRRSLTVRETLHEVDGALVTESPKSAASARTFALPTELVELLAAHLAGGDRVGDPDAYVFVAPRGGPLRYAGFRTRVWVPACERAGLTGVGFHDLRRTNATAMVQAGVDMRVAQHRLGHTDPRLTFGVYAQATSEADRSAAEALGQRFFGADAESDRGTGSTSGG